MWVQTGGPPGKPVVIFDYDPSRSAEVPVRLLHDYRGYLMADGYTGYNKLANTEGIERLACWAHARRRFVDASRVQPKGKRGLANCVFRSNWTLSPPQTDQRSHGKLDSYSGAI
jgi:hypothetical protein